MSAQTTSIEPGQVWQWLEHVPDPEIPVISIVELGIVRGVALDPDGTCVVTITPTYSGCPAMAMIAAGIRDALAAHGVLRYRLDTRLRPAWTTDWMDEPAREKLRACGIAPPGPSVADYQRIDIGSLVRQDAEAPVPCPRCGSERTRLVSRFGSTSCKALYACQSCREPFDHFKGH